MQCHSSQCIITCAGCTVYCISSSTIQRRQCIWLSRPTAQNRATRWSFVVATAGWIWRDKSSSSTQVRQELEGVRGLELQVLPAAQRPACQTGGPAINSSLRNVPGVPCNACSTCNACHAPAPRTRNHQSSSKVMVPLHLPCITGLISWHDVDVCIVCKTQTSSRMLAAAHPVRETTGAGIRGFKKARCSNCAPTAAAHSRRG